jgi:heme-degrading monooxygenase HmoA
MIARIWHGKTSAEKFDAYTEFLKKVAVPDYNRTNGFISLSFLKRLENNQGHFTLVTFWQDIEVIKNFAGEDYEKAKYYPEDDDFLLEFEEKVSHHEVFA